MAQKTVCAARKEGGFISLLAAGTLLVFAALFLPRLAVATEGEGAPSLPEQGGADLAAGDNVKITFFELLDLPGASSDGKASDRAQADQPPLRSFYQRLDLTGEYTVQLDGSVSIPRMGTFSAAQRSLLDLQSEIADTFERSMGRPCEVTITILDRQPVYVMGAARNPGAYKFVPGMLVLHALALAGGLERQAERSGQLIDFLREKERQVSIESRLKRLLAQKARLEAERDGLTEAIAPSRLTNLASVDEMRTLMETENALLAQQQRTYDEEMRRSAEEIDAVRRELAAIESRRDQNQHLVELRQKRLTEMTELAGKGVVSGPNLTLARTDLAEVVSKADEASLLMAQAEQKIQQAERNAARITDERNARITHDLAANVEETMRTEREQVSAQRISDALSFQSPELMADAASARIGYEIVRRERTQETTSIKADEMTPLAPGDIVRVKMLSTSDMAQQMLKVSPQ